MFDVIFVLLCVISASAAETPNGVQERSSACSDTVDALATINEKLARLEWQIDTNENQLTQRLDNMFSYCDWNELHQQLFFRPYPAVTDPDPEVQSEKVCADQYGSRLAEIQTQPELDTVSIYLSATLGDQKTAGVTHTIRVGLRTNVQKDLMVHVDRGEAQFQGPRCIVISDYTMPGDVPVLRVWRLYAKDCSLKASGGVLCSV